MELGKAVLLGAIQGITEFLPVSSTGHLILTEKLLGISQETYGLAFDASLHIGTLVAVIWFFRDRWKGLIAAFFSVLKSHAWKTQEEKLTVCLIAATLPAALIVILLEKTINRYFRSPLLVAVSLIGFSIVLVAAEKWGRQQHELKELSLADSVLVGLGQAIALIPGVSRSGITIAFGMWRNLNRQSAATFAFLLSTPIIAAAGGKEVLQTLWLFFHGKLEFDQIEFFAIGMISAGVFGYLTIKYFMRYISHRSLYPFIIYRVVLGVVIITSLFLFK